MIFCNMGSLAISSHVELMVTVLHILSYSAYIPFKREWSGPSHYCVASVLHYFVTLGWSLSNDH